MWNTLIFHPLMNAILVLYSFFGNNLGWAIIVLTIILKFALYPFTKSQLASSRKMKEIQPQLEKIQKKYKRNPKKIQEEQLKLYKKVGYNPLGCFFSVLLPLPILIAIYQAVRTFTGGEVTGIYQFVKDMLGANGKIEIDTFFYFMDLSKSYLPLAQDVGYLKIETLPYLVLVVLTGISQYVSVKVTSAQTVAKDDKKSVKGGKAPEEDMAASMSKSMAYTFPLLTTFVALSMPSGVALYWVVQSFITVISQLIYNKMSVKKK